MFRGILLDLDGTLTPVRSSWQYIHERIGLWTGRADAHQQLFRAGDISYEEFCLRDAAEWKGLPVSRLEEAAAGIGYLPGVLDLMRRVRGAGLKTGIVSTGLTVLADRVRRELELDDAQANHLEVTAGLLSGRVEVRVSHGRKDMAVFDFCRRYGLRPHEIIAVGDSEGDISMFDAVGHAIAFNASQASLAAISSHVTTVCSGPNLEALAAALPLPASDHIEG